MRQTGLYEDPCLQVAAQYVMSPPIRSVEHQKKLRQALAGQALQIVATDHCPFNKSQKAAGMKDFRNIPNGVNGIEVGIHHTNKLCCIRAPLIPLKLCSDISTIDDFSKMRWTCNKCLFKYITCVYELPGSQNLHKQLMC